jgi:hypothetical protein
MKYAILLLSVVMYGCATAPKEDTSTDSLPAKAPEKKQEPGNYNRMHVHVRPCDLPSETRSVADAVRWLLVPTGYQLVSEKWVEERPMARVGGGCGMVTVEDAIKDAIGSDNRIVIQVMRRGGKVAVEKIPDGKMDRVVFGIIE